MTCEEYKLVRSHQYSLLSYILLRVKFAFTNYYFNLLTIIGKLYQKSADAQVRLFPGENERTVKSLSANVKLDYKAAGAF